MQASRSFSWTGLSKVQSLAALLAIFGTAPTAALAVNLTAVEATVSDIIAKAKTGCQKDLDTYCADVTPGEGRLAYCLVAYADKRSSTCEAALGVVRTEVEGILNTIDIAVEACRGDISALCGGTEPGEGRIAQCLVDQRPSLSPACGDVVDIVGRIVLQPRNEAAVEADATVPPNDAATSTQAQPQAGKASIGVALRDEVAARVQRIMAKGKEGCQADLDRYCAHVTPGEGRLALCLIAHADKRSPQCEAALSEARSEAEKIIDLAGIAVEACAPDIAALCSGTEPGEGRIAQCLADQRPALTNDCGIVFDELSRVIFQARNAAIAPEPVVNATEPAQEEVEKDTCKTLRASVTDWSQSATSQDARSLLKKRISGFVAKRGLTDYTSERAKVECVANVDLLVAGNYTCTARSIVCWPAKKD